jgi:hypothetical protein
MKLAFPWKLPEGNLEARSDARAEQVLDPSCTFDA